MKIYLILVPFFNALGGWLSVVLFLHILLKWIIPSKQESICQASIQKLSIQGEPNPLILKLEQMDLESEVSPVLDQRLNQLIAQLKEQIPMGEIVLPRRLAERLKGRAKQEILKALPEIKERLVEKVKKEFDFGQLIEAHINALDFTQLESYLTSEMSDELRMLKGIGAAIGLVIGCLELPLLMWMC